MNLFLALQIMILALALVCVALMPGAAWRDHGLATRIVEIDGLSVARWPDLLMRIGIVGLLASFGLLLAVCYTILGSIHP
ncbi:hypothetical protein [Paraburkholderia sp. DGU8]|uniref:hypothetical protein n=1 Tax=Paraburkholderia sp. DGU8 TaxID=3161997 RepID=UPI003465FA47